MSNFFAIESLGLNEETINEIFTAKNVRIEQIVSRGQITPQNEFYDQEEAEWVIILEGSGELTYADGSVVSLKKGEYHYIPPHAKHRVTYTENPTLWLCIFFQA